MSTTNDTIYNVSVDLIYLVAFALVIWMIIDSRRFFKKLKGYERETNEALAKLKSMPVNDRAELRQLAIDKLDKSLRFAETLIECSTEPQQLMRVKSLLDSLSPEIDIDSPHLMKYLELLDKCSTPQQ